MTEGLFIKRRKGSEQSESFNSLRREGIELAQQLCGELWTDFNLHDPGVTILEQLAYAITELIYRADFPIADLLSGEHGIDYVQQALYAPEQIFPSRPTTLLDYRKAMLNELSELDNCWFKPFHSQEGAEKISSGLYKILLKSEREMSAAQRTAIVGKVAGWYRRHRNLCEDLAEVTWVNNLEYTLCAQVEVDGSQPPVELLAKIYFTCIRRVSGSVVFHDYSQAVVDHSLEEIFSGPFTDKGLLKDAELAAEVETFQISTLYAAIKRLEGVDQVITLHLERDGRAYYDSLAGGGAETALNLRIPQNPTEVQVVLSMNGRVLPVSFEELKGRIDELNLRYYSSRSTPQDLSLVYRLPQGKARELRQYYSIQNHFPAAYGIGAFGVPESASPEVKARAQQLKSYLLIFEQIMANYLANLDSLPGLFSLDKQAHNTYAFTVLRDNQIAGLGDLYPDNPAQELARIVLSYDDYHERKGRLLDYLLALYGESYPQDAFRHFSHYYLPHELEQRIIEQKIDFLQAVVELGRDRAAAGDFAGAAWDQHALSGVERRVNRLLGFPHPKGRSLVFALRKQGLKLARHSTYTHLKKDTEDLRYLAADAPYDIDQTSWTEVPLRDEAGDLALQELRDQIGDAIPLRNNLLSDLLLSQGIHIERYRLISEKSRPEVQLCFRCAEDQYWRLGSYPDRESGVRAANALRRLLIHLNIESEGLHLLEHILLRPLAAATQEDSCPAPGEGFYAFRISVIYPAWTARCRDPQFRLLAEETVRLNTPAHIYAQFFWLEFHELHEFEGLYIQWLKLKGEAADDSTELDRLSGSLRRFLLEQVSRTEREAGH